MSPGRIGGARPRYSQRMRKHLRSRGLLTGVLGGVGGLLIGVVGLLKGLLFGLGRLLRHVV
jgi:hypothetical protein